MMFALLPPSSSWTRLICSPARDMMRRPVAVEPVKVTMSTSGWPESSSPTSPWPVMTFKTPGGMSASAAARAISKASSGVQGWGLRTTEHPTARAGMTFTMLSIKGKLKGVMAATTPTGSRTTALPATPPGPPVGGDDSIQWTKPWACSALKWPIPMAPPHCTASTIMPAQPVSATINSRRWACRASRISAIFFSRAPRSAGFMKGQGPSSNARRAAAIAERASSTVASGT